MASSKRDSGDWVTAISSITAKQGLYPPGYPDGWKTFEEIQKEQKIGHNKLRRIIQLGVKEGTIKAFEGTSPNITGRLCRSVWYKIIKLAKR